MSQLTIIKKKENLSSDPLQKKFDSLQKELASLEERYKKQVVELDRHLHFYQTRIQPLHLQICDLLKEQIKIIYKYGINKRIFNKQAKRVIFHLLSNLFYELTSKSNNLGLEEELSIIFEEVEGISYEKLLSEGFHEIQEMVDELFVKQGIRVDLTDFDYSGSEEEILQRLFARIQEQNALHEKESPERDKQEEIKLKEQQVEDLQKKSLSTIYKQLAKAIHPDLEIDPVQKKEKESLMKKLTLAYEENDLHTLLTLERQWSYKKNLSHKNLSPDLLKQYNTILLDQVLSLKKNIANLITQPKYFPLQRYYKDSVDMMGARLSKELKSLQKKIPFNKTLTAKLQSSAVVDTIKSMIYK